MRVELKNGFHCKGHPTMGANGPSKGIPTSMHTFRSVNVYNIILVYGWVCESDGPQKYGVIRILGMGMETCENRTMGN